MRADEAVLRRAFGVDEDEYFGDAFRIKTQEQRDVVAPWVPEWPDEEVNECFLEVHQA